MNLHSPGGEKKVRLGVAPLIHLLFDRAVILSTMKFISETLESIYELLIFMVFLCNSWLLVKEDQNDMIVLIAYCVT